MCVLLLFLCSFSAYWDSLLEWKGTSDVFTVLLTHWILKMKVFFTYCSLHSVPIGDSIKCFLQPNLNDLRNMALITALRREVCDTLWSMYLINRKGFWMGNIEFSYFIFPQLLQNTSSYSNLEQSTFFLGKKCTLNPSSWSYFLEGKLS